MTDPRQEWHGRHVPPAREETSWREGFWMTVEIVGLTFGLINATIVYLAYVAFDVE